MTPDDAAAVSQEFLRELVLEDEYATRIEDGEEHDRALSVQHVVPRDGGIHVLFAVESDEDLDDPDDPEVHALAKKAIGKLRAAHPEVFRTPVTWEVIA